MEKDSIFSTGQVDGVSDRWPSWVVEEGACMRLLYRHVMAKRSKERVSLHFIQNRVWL